MRSQLSKEQPSQINMYKYYRTYWFILHWWYARMSQHISFQNLVPKWVSQTRPKQQTCPSKDCPIILGLSWVSKWVSQTRPKQQPVRAKTVPSSSVSHEYQNGLVKQDPNSKPVRARLSHHPRVSHEYQNGLVKQDPNSKPVRAKTVPIILGLSWVSRHWTPTYGFQGRWEGRRQLKGCVKVAVAVLDCSGWLLH